MTTYVRLVKSRLSFDDNLSPNALKMWMFLNKTSMRSVTLVFVGILFWSYLVTDMVYVSYVEKYNVFVDIHKPTIEAAMPYDDWFLIKRSPSCENNTEARITM